MRTDRTRAGRPHHWTSLVAALALGTAFVAGCAVDNSTSNVTNPTQSRTISVSGIGSTTVHPDTASLSLGVHAEADTATAALEQVNAAATRLIDAIKAAGVADDDITTTGLYVYPSYGMDGRITSHQASNTVTVTVRDIDATGPVIDAAAAAAGEDVTIGGVSFYVDDTEKVLGAARAAAVANAKEHARQYADAAGVKVGKVMWITESSVSWPTDIRYGDKGSEGTPTPVQTGTQRLTVSVGVIFQIAD